MEYILYLQDGFSYGKVLSDRELILDSVFVLGCCVYKVLEVEGENVLLHEISCDLTSVEIAKEGAKK